MNPRKNYVSQLLNDEYQSLERYGSILSVFNSQINDKGIETDTRQYEELLKREQLRIEKIQKVLKTFPHEYTGKQSNIARDELIDNCRIMLKRIVKSIDRNRCRLHDELRSLNKNNSALGLRYNRYVTTGTEPGIIDITL